MGRVYTAEALANKTVPSSTEAHYKAATALIDAFNSWGELRLGPDGYLHSKDDMAPPESYFVYGSVALGLATIRSDVDFFVGYGVHYASESALLSQMQTVMDRIANQYRVHIEPHISSYEALRVGAANIDPLFADHLVDMISSSQFYGKANWSKLIMQTSHDVSPAQVELALMRYLHGKKRSFAKPLPYEHDYQHQNLQRCLELPKAIGRKITHMLGASSLEVSRGIASPSTDLLAVSEQALTGVDLGSQAEAIGAHESIKVAYSWLSAANTEYDQLLRAALEENVDVAEYSKWLKDRYTPARRHALELCLAMLRRTELVRPSQDKSWGGYHYLSEDEIY